MTSIRYYESYKALKGKLVALKCDHCVDRQESGEKPACVEVCKVKALLFGDINELTRTASSQLARAVSVAAGTVPAEPIRLPAHYQAWRDWGAATSELARR